MQATFKKRHLPAASTCPLRRRRFEKGEKHEIKKKKKEGTYSRGAKERRSEGLVVVSFRLSIRSWDSFSKGGNEQVTAMFRTILGRLGWKTSWRVKQGSNHGHSASTDCLRTRTKSKVNQETNYFSFPRSVRLRPTPLK